MGGGGIIIIKKLAESVSPTDSQTLNEIANRNPARCSLTDAMRVLRIVWKYLRP